MNFLDLFNGDLLFGVNLILYGSLIGRFFFGIGIIL